MDNSGVEIMATQTIKYIYHWDVGLYESCGWSCKRMDHPALGHSYMAIWDDSLGEPIYPEGESNG